MDNIAKQSIKYHEIDSSNIEYKEYNLNENNHIYKIIIEKKNSFILIKYENNEIFINKDYFSKLTGNTFNNLDNIYKYILNLFEEKKVSIISNTITNLKMNINKDKNIILLDNKDNHENKDLIIKELNQSINNLKNEINDLKERNINLEEQKKIFQDKINSLNNKINFLETKINTQEISNFRPLNMNLYKNYDLDFKKAPSLLKYSRILFKDCLIKNNNPNTVCVFKSINDILFVIYLNKKNSIICYNLLNFKRISEIKNAHYNISSFIHYLDKINNRDLITSISKESNSLKIWNFKNWECLLFLIDKNSVNAFLCASFLYDNNQNYIITNISRKIKIYDFKGIEIKEINSNDNHIRFIDTYFDKDESKNYIIIGNKGFTIAFDYKYNKIYHKYTSDENESHYHIIIVYDKKLTKLIEASKDLHIRIWNFHSALLIKKIKFNHKLNGLCLWNNKYLLVGNKSAKIIIIDIDIGKEISYIKSNDMETLSIKKCIHPIFGECLVAIGSLFTVEAFIYLSYFNINI